MARVRVIRARVRDMGFRVNRLWVSVLMRGDLPRVGILGV